MRSRAGPEAEAHAIKSREVGRSLRRRDHVIGGNRIFGVRQRNRLHLAARLAQPVQRSLDGRANLRVQPLAEVLRRNTDAQTLHRFCQRAHIISNRPVGAGRILCILSGENAQHRGRVAHVGCERPHAIQRRSEGDQPVARDAPICRQHADHATEGRRLANRSAGVGAQRCHGHVGRHCCRRATRSSARGLCTGP